jgi:aerobic-type carbon monoxide dehydrogenase small subunit (CoxS/CutS family)
VRLLPGRHDHGGDGAAQGKADINNAITNICRCGTYQQVRAAIHAAASA